MKHDCNSYTALHYHLVCKTCGVELLPVVATVLGELLHLLAVSETCPCCGADTKEPWGLAIVSRFHQEHAGHELVERECGVTLPNAEDKAV